MEIVRFKTFGGASFTINLEELCKDEVKTCTCYDPQRKKTFTEREHDFYPVNKAKKLFRLMVRDSFLQPEILDQVEEYLKEHNRKLYEVFRKERT